MGKVACEIKKFREPDQPKYECKKCGVKVKREDKVCKPRKL